MEQERGAVDSSPRPSPMRPVAGVVLALAVAIAILGARMAGLLDGRGALALAVLLGVAVPSSRMLSRRILINGSLVLGWVPLLWWVRFPHGEVDRAGIILALTAGALVAWVTAAPRIGERARRLVPNLGVMDAAPVCAAFVTAWLTWPLLASAGGDRTLNLLMKSGWDHGAHFQMVHLIRSAGAIGSSLPMAPDGTAWGGSTYPQHFHAMLVGLVELSSGATLGTPAVEVLRYGQGLSLIHIFVAGLLAAGVAQLPGLRARPAIGLPLAAGLVALFVVGPGAVALTNGYPNFVFAAAAVCLVVLLASSVTGFSLTRLLAISGLVVATTHAWVLLGPIAAAGACVAIIAPPESRPWPRRRPQLVAAAVALLVAATACIAVIPILSGSGATGAMTIGGPPEFSMSMLLLASGAALVTAFLPLQFGSSGWRDRRVWGSALPTLTGLIMLAVMAAYQLLSSGQLAYYFGKLAVGVTFVAFTSFVLAVAWTCEDRMAGVARRRISGIALGLVGAFAAFQFFGYVGPQPATPFAGTAALLEYRNTAQVLMAGPSGESLRMLDAAKVAGQRQFGETSYIAALPGDPIPVLADQWAQALSLNWAGSSVRAFPDLASIGAQYTGPEQIVHVMTQITAADPGRKFVMAPEVASEVRQLSPPRLRGHVITW